MARRRKYIQVPSEDALSDSALPESAPAEVVVKAPKVPFEIWADAKVKTGKIRKHQLRALRIFLKKQGLGDCESRTDYDQALSKF